MYRGCWDWWPRGYQDSVPVGWAWAEVPQGSSPSWAEVPTGKGCKGAKGGKGGTEARACQGRVGPSPYASKGKDPQGKGRGVGPSPDASTGKGCKGAKDGRRPPKKKEERANRSGERGS